MVENLDIFSYFSKYLTHAQKIILMLLYNLNIFLEKNMKRRKFLLWGFVGTIVNYLIASSSNVKAQSTQIISDKDNKNKQGFITIGSLSQLKKEGSILKEESEIGDVLLIKKGENSAIAVDPTCTHAGCIVDFNKSNFLCPCHQSKFTLEGKVIEGSRAKSSLKSYQVKIVGDDILVK